MKVPGSGGLAVHHVVGGRAFHLVHVGPDDFARFEVEELEGDLRVAADHPGALRALVQGGDAAAEAEVGAQGALGHALGAHVGDARAF